MIAMATFVTIGATYSIGDKGSEALPEPNILIMESNKAECRVKNINLEVMHKGLEGDPSNLSKGRGSDISNSKSMQLNKVNEQAKLSNEELAQLVIKGKYGDGEERKYKIEKEGYDYNEVQKIVKEKTTTIVDDSNSSEVKTKSSKIIKAYPHKTFKSYMKWTALSKSSPQGKLAAKSNKDPSTAIMKYKGRYLVALGFAYADRIGEEIDIVMESGQVIPAIVGDWKAKADTDSNNSSSLNNGSVVEFIVSSNADANNVLNGSGNYDSIFPGRVKKFVK